MTKLCSVCRNVYEQSYGKPVCEVPVDRIEDFDVLCAGGIIEVQCLLCMDEGTLTVLGETRDCSRGCRGNLPE